MRPVLVVYATRHGHTRHVAERVADRVRTLRHEAQLQDARTEALPPLERYSAVVLAASVHLGHHEREMVKFVRARRNELEALPTVFLSVSLTEVGARDVRRPDDERLEAQRATHKAIEDFVLETGWRPPQAVQVAGALTENTYGPLARMLLRRLARRKGLPDEASRDIVFTDWVALNGVVDALVQEAVERSPRLPPPTPDPAPEAVKGAPLAP